LQVWRDQLADKQDEVVEDRDTYRIRTRSGSGELTAATLTIRRQDLRPLEERLEFSNREWVEITELAGQPAPEPNAIAAAEVHSTGAGATTPGLLANRVSPPASSTLATIGDELRVLTALNRVGADLGDPIDVSRSGREILVTGVGIAPQRQQEIQNALSSQARVVVRFSESTPDKVQPEKEAPTESAARPDMQPLQARLAEQIGGRVYFAQLAAQVLDMSEPMMSRAYALRRLAERFPVEIESELSAQDWQLLRSLQHEHAEALKRQTAEIERLLRPALGPVSGLSRIEPVDATLSSAWQPATEELFQSARGIEKMLAVLFGAAAGEAPDERLPSQLLSNLAQLRARAEAYDRPPGPAPARGK